MAKPDWEAIETAYRAGVMSLREIASQHGISEGAIRKPLRFEINTAHMGLNGGFQAIKKVATATFNYLS
ncbi:hypothetical protein IGC89_000205 [Escherichia coli]|nr:hypothetical protein [Escherichia coli]EFM4248499.1 hypothetical protein [Escherichia coli]EGI3121350.1 hypothetical protein [Escherichia coli]EGI3126647.1 hypothetical protein [Escherichia coli]EGI3140257.1 hypothetical protein [Escherichia coli]